jgi:geranylgeranyl diphosphate synthase type II
VPLSFDSLFRKIADDILDVTATSEELGKTAGKDEDTNKMTYVKLLGLEGAKAEAAAVVTDAKTALAPFGDRAGPLLAIADFIVARQN